MYIDGNCEVTNQAETHNLTIKASHGGINPKLIIQPAKSMTVLGTLDGVLTNNAGTSGLIVKSSSTQPNGTLIYPNSESNPVSGTVEMYSKAYWNLQNEVNSRYSWQFFGIPVKTLSYSSSFKNCYVREWDETVSVYENLWVRRNDGSSLTLGTGSTLTSLKGYELVQQSPKTYTFAGQLENREFTRSLPYTFDAVYPGQHIFANPYTAAIDIKKLEFGNNTEAAVYFYNSGTYNDWLMSGGEISPGNGPGQYTVSTPETIGELEVPDQIPSMQAFLVKAMGATGSITIPYSSVVSNSSQQRVKSSQVTSDKVVTRID